MKADWIVFMLKNENIYNILCFTYKKVTDYD